MQAESSVGMNESQHHDETEILDRVELVLPVDESPDLDLSDGQTRAEMSSSNLPSNVVPPAEYFPSRQVRQKDQSSLEPSQTSSSRFRERRKSTMPFQRMSTTPSRPARSRKSLSSISAGSQKRLSSISAGPRKRLSSIHVDFKPPEKFRKAVAKIPSPQKLNASWMISQLTGKRKEKEKQLMMMKNIIYGATSGSSSSSLISVQLVKECLNQINEQTNISNEDKEVLNRCSESLEVYEEGKNMQFSELAGMGEKHPQMAALLVKSFSNEEFAKSALGSDLVQKYNTYAKSLGYNPELNAFLNRLYYYILLLGVMGVLSSMTLICAWLAAAHYLRKRFTEDAVVSMCSGTLLIFTLFAFRYSSYRRQVLQQSCRDCYRSIVHPIVQPEVNKNEPAPEKQPQSLEEENNQ